MKFRNTSEQNHYKKKLIKAASLIETLAIDVTKKKYNGNHKRKDPC